ncbi:Beta-galactosidase 8 [Gracilariopsis chorda]|uniref:Beta-galactosidase 8 n=1 Tax=Gracilariopsis chorda TaxID=448386 RepID=A0A2V3J2Z0_9FLOR|nr:Beta-galactosidase 8 [Gracilariopsis chorda]|eukprot:PXF48816.1 Beta-galactosidase 8 [Gracilariopsis chorda]
MHRMRRFVIRSQTLCAMPRFRQTTSRPHASSLLTSTPQWPQSRPRSHKLIPAPRLLVTLTALLTVLFILFVPHPSLRPTVRSSTLHGQFAAGPSAEIARAAPRRLSYNSRNFTLDNVRIRMVSGSLHYFRTVPSQWPRLLRYARAMGLNAIETYVPWNLHEQSPGNFRFAGILDLRQFLEHAYRQNLLVLLRPGPYICSEWDLGGLPPYLLAHDSMRLRSMHPKYIGAVERYFDELAHQIAPYIGKPIVALQLENEFGAYGVDDPNYMHWLLRAWRKRSFPSHSLMFFTSDNGGPGTVSRGSPFSANVLKTINLEVNVIEKVAMLKRIQPYAPPMIAEFWTGWFDHWGERHHVRNATDVASNINLVLNHAHASINLYMFFGGTNFGYMAGANIAENRTYLATTTSYDYDAFVTEYADVRKEKFKTAQKVIRNFWHSLNNQEMVNATLEPLPGSPFMSAYAGTVLFTESISLYDVLDIVTDNHLYSRYPLTMEEVGSGYGFIMYRCVLDGPPPAGSNIRILQISGVRDFAYVLADGIMLRTIDRNRQFESDGQTLKRIHLPAETHQLDIIVENRGRVNYGKYIHDRKGILGNVTLDGHILEQFENFAFSFPQDHPLLPDTHGNKTISKLRDSMSGVNAHPPLATRSSPPTFFRGEMSINPGSQEAFGGEFPGTHCRVFGRGVLWVNGFNVGRFHTGVAGPQRSLFVPGALLREGRNEFMVLHMNMHLTRDPPKLQLFEQPDFGSPS